ncbi:hypothetical protein [Streptomyces luteireticuli]|uniref:Uncharacterized protein n=1 Tax=Streptomyces luteireticuli TaxID=173858 RepID=A0ABP3I0I0_9ACTN
MTNPTEQRLPARIPTPEEQAAFLDAQGEERYAPLEPGQTVHGEITEILILQDTDYATRQPLWIEPGLPQLMLRLRLRNGSGPAAERWIVEIRKGQRRDVVKQAVKDSKATFLEVGGRLELACVSRQGNRKVYAARYEPPTVPSPTPTANVADAQRAAPGAFTLPGDPAVHPRNAGFPVPEQPSDAPPF